MKRLVAVLVLLVLLGVGLWVGSAYWFGVKAEQQYHALLHQASEWQYLKCVNTNYQRGLFKSQAETVIEVELPPGTNGEIQTFKIPLAQEIIHGPFPFGNFPNGQRSWQPVMAIIETRLAPGSELQTLFAELWTQVPELASARDYTVIYLDGKGEERLVIPAFQNSFGKEEPIAVTWQGLSFQADFTADFKAFSGSLTMPGSELRGGEASLRLGEVKAAFATKEGISGLWLGDASGSLATLEFSLQQDTGLQSFLLQGFNASTATTASGDTLNSQVAIRTELVKVDGTQYGPGVFEMELRNLDAPSLAKLQQSLREQPIKPGQQPAEAAQMKTLATLMEILPGLLKKSPEIEIKQLDLKTSRGDFTGKARVGFDGTKAGSIQNLTALATALTAQAEVKIGEDLLRHALTAMLQGDVAAEVEEQEEETSDEESEGLERAVPTEEEIRALVAKRVDEQLASLTAQNLLVKEDGTYGSSARYEGGQMILNGRPLSLQDLVQ